MAYQQQEHTGFIGVNIRTSRSNAKDQHAAKALNVDFNKELGTATIRNGRTTQAELSDSVIRTIAKVNGFRYYVAGRHLYRASTQVSLSPLELDDGLITDIEGMRPLNDTTIWAFVADIGDDTVAAESDAIELGTMRKDNGTVNRKWGIAVPPAFLLRDVDSGVTSPGAGTFTHNLTHIRHDGAAIAHEGNPITLAITIVAPA